MVIPIQSAVPMDRYPWANIALVVVTVVVSLGGIVDDSLMFRWALGQRDVVPAFEVLKSIPGIELPDRPSSIEFPWPGYVTHGFVHADVLHLAGNMLFLFVFGNAVNAKLGHIRYVLVYLLLLAGAAVVQVPFLDQPAVGASGAIYGLLGFFVVFFPANDVTFFWFVFYRMNTHSGTFEVASIWAILYWVAENTLLLTLGFGGGIGLRAHLGGFVLGFVLGLMFVAMKLVSFAEWDRNLVDLLRR